MENKMFVSMIFLFKSERHEILSVQKIILLYITLTE